jgi:hypothetical protein
MTKSKFAAYVVGGLVILPLFSPIASAQSTISGVVRDMSGAVMSGVSVEAASDALIEKSRGALTAGDGRYTIVDVRPGEYIITFTLPGFATVKREVTVPANVSVPVDAEMKVGAVGETVRVEATVPTVDVENVAHPQVLTRGDMDAVPSARNMQSLGSYVPSVHLNTPDVAGSMQVQQTYLQLTNLQSAGSFFSNGIFRHVVAYMEVHLGRYRLQPVRVGRGHVAL